MSKSKSKAERVKTLPWAALAQVAVIVGRSWRGLSKRERTRLSRLARDSRGRPGNLTAKERAELRKLIGKLDLRGNARALFAVGRRSRRRGRG